MTSNTIGLKLGKRNGINYKNDQGTRIKVKPESIDTGPKGLVNPNLFRAIDWQGNP